MLTNEGLVLPFEINPRISTTFCLAMAAGLDPIEAFLDNFVPLKSYLDYNDNVRIRRFWHNNISS